MSAQEKPSKKKSWLKKLVVVFWVGFTLAIIGFPAYLWAVSNNVNNWFGSLPSYSQLENPEQNLTSLLFTADGVQLGSGYYRDNRNPVSYDELGDNLVHALLAAEDIRFNQHSGIDLESMFRVAFGVITFSPKGGGSTITQQLAKNLFNTRVIKKEDKGKLEGINGFLDQLIYKTKEWILAVRLERSYTKEEIMAMYYNTVEFGNNAFGIKSAAKTYFNKMPKELSVDEAAVLAGMQKGVTTYRPDINPENSKRRRNVVLSQMVKYGFLAQQAYDTLRTKDINLDEFRQQDHNTGLAQYFRAEASKDLLELCKALGYDLYGDGLKIYTTIDSRMQAYAEDAMDSAMQRIQNKFDSLLKIEGRDLWIDNRGREIENFFEENAVPRSVAYRNLVRRYGKESDSVDYYMNRPKKMTVFSWGGDIDTVLSSRDSIRYYKQFLQSGFLATEPKTGAIKAWVGGINFQHFKYDHVRYGKRQPGSLFKPFVYATAVEQGYSPCYTFKDEAVAIPTGNGDEVWSPSNSEGRFSGEEMTLKLAMARSVNSITARVMEIVKPNKVVDMAKRLGIKSTIPPYYSIALGTEDVSLFELLGAYGTFANKGTHIEPYYISRIEDKYGNEIYRHVPRKSKAINEDVAYVMLNMLQETVKSGSGQRLSWQYGLVDRGQTKNNIGAKTGTTQNGSDGWFIAVTNEVVAGAWVGGDERPIHFTKWSDGQGAYTALPIVGRFLQKIYADNTLSIEKTFFERPPNLSIEVDCQKFADVLTTTDTSNIYDDDIY
ncbi:transglycosylase domain-containing protein [Roseivirga sp. UBA1976]|uniref:penicillin-binding protein 1A n=1 Tax=Roseivirga sp. UBA1976 TaxID=1947386 RepID=UPI00257ECB61|nr:transglycosylase domain-containing protein [Roseivirga sp. UBA1976]MEC7752834.1 transglycosylase domain-containing protein [Bacteroidota bacterium]